jgi:hypothetical protein
MITGKKLLFRIIEDLINDHEINWIQHLTAVGRAKFKNYPVVLVDSTRIDHGHGEVIDTKTDECLVTIVIKGMNDNDIDEEKILLLEDEIKSKSQDLISKIYKASREFPDIAKIEFGKGSPIDDFTISAVPVIFLEIPVTVTYDAKTN